MTRVWKRSVGLLCLLSMACDSTPTPQVDHQKLLSEQIIDGTTTREQVLLRFGDPSAQFEGGRILTYRINISPEGQPQVVARTLIEGANDRLVSSWERPLFSLVLVFEGNRVVRHSVVKMH